MEGGNFFHAKFRLELVDQLGLKQNKRCSNKKVHSFLFNILCVECGPKLDETESHMEISDIDEVWAALVSRDKRLCLFFF